jgi:hypothetical protein
MINYIRLVIFQKMTALSTWSILHSARFIKHSSPLALKTSLLPFVYCLLRTRFFLGLHVGPEDGGDVFR